MTSAGPGDDFASFRARARELGPGIVPLVRELVLDGVTGVGAFAAIHRGRFGFLLESLEGGERWARYTILGTEPRAVYRYTGTMVERWTPAEGWRRLEETGSPLDHIGALMRSRRAAEIPGLPPFYGGAVGFLGYDVVRALERLGTPPPDDRNLPDAVLLIADSLVLLDNVRQRASLIMCVDVADPTDDAGLEASHRAAVGRLDEWMERLAHAAPLPPLALRDAPAPSVTSPYRADAFMAGVRRIQEHIAAGDTFQTVLSRRLDVAAPDPFLTYRCLRALNPAPYLFYLQLDDLFLAGSSPEVLVRVERGEVTVRPIAGTRRRGATPDEDAALERELAADPKELAEHRMLLDLGRNDVGRVAAYGSVRVTARMTIERYSHVMHLVSEVRGTLRPECDALDAFAACFPAGTVSGAPKVRAMEIIDSLEPTRRGPYAGAVGYIGWGARTLDTAIAIRTCVMQGGRAWIQAGAGIVADSDPVAELRETEAKAAAVLRAVALAATAG